MTPERQFELPHAWTGGVNLPTTTGGRINVSEPFGTLMVSPGMVEIEAISPAGKMTRSEPLRAAPSDLVHVWEVRYPGLFGAIRFRGVGIRAVNGHEYYFKTLFARQILAALKSQGFPVSDQRGTAQRRWQGIP